MSKKHDQQEPDNDVSYDDHCYECTGYDDEIRYDYGVKDEAIN